MSRFRRYETPKPELRPADNGSRHEKGHTAMTASLAAVVKRRTAGPTTIAVTWSKHGTVQEEIPFLAPGAVIWQSWPDVIGLRCTYSEADEDAASAGDEEELFFGVVTDLAVEGATVSLTVAPQTARVGGRGDKLSRIWMPPRSQNQCTVSLAGTIAIREGGGFFFATGGLNGDVSGFGYLRIVTEDERWAVIAVTGTALEGSFGELGTVYTPDGSVGTLQVGRGRNVHPFEQWSDVWGAGGDADERVLARAEWVDVYTASDDRHPSDIVEDIFSGTTRPWGVSLRLTSDEYDDTSLDVLDSAIDVGDLRSPGLGPGWSNVWVGPFVEADTPILEHVVEEYVEPAACGLVPAESGALVFIDWALVLVADATVTTSEVFSDRIGWRRHRGAVLRMVELTSKTGRDTNNELVISEVASAVHGGGKEKEIEIYGLGLYLPTLRQRWISIMGTYERSLPDATMTIASSVAVNVGEVLNLQSINMIPAVDGTRGGASMRMLVTEVGVERSAAQPTRGLLLGDDIGARWGPTASVVSYSAGDVTIKPQDWSDPDGAANDVDHFTVGDYAILLDGFGTEKVGTATEITAKPGGDVLTVNFPTAVNGDTIVLADYDETGQAGNSWGGRADESATLGAANDDAAVYS